MSQFRRKLDERAEAIRAARAESDRKGRLAASSHQLLVDGGYYKLLVPREYGGSEMPLPDALAVFAAACRIDGAFGWNATIGAGGGLFAAWLPDRTAEKIYAPDDALVAGSGAPLGKLKPANGGFRASGRWPYCSGVHHATWITANAMIEEDAIRAVAVPRSAIEVQADWDVEALRATGSDTVAINDVFVPDDHTFDLSGPARIGRPLYRFPFISAAETSFAAAIIGTTWGTFDRFMEGPAQRRVGDRRALEHIDTRRRIAEARMELGAGWAFLERETDELWAAVADDDDAVEELVLEVSLASVKAAECALSAVRELKEATGMIVLQRNNPTGIAIRDTEAMAQHVMISSMRKPELGRTIARSAAAD